MSIAHLRFTDSGETRLQTLAEHSRNVANYTSKTLEEIGLCTTGYLAGLLHDCGKATAAFNDYITRAAKGEKVRKGSINHTFAGIMLLNELISQTNSCEKLTFELIACAMGSHHGLFDGIDPNGKSGLLHRLEKNADEIFYPEARRTFLLECAKPDEITGLFQKAAAEIQLYYARIRSVSCVRSKDELDYFFAMTERLLSSALIDADRRDTAEFYGTGSRLPDAADRPFWDAPLQNLEEWIANFLANTSINQARKSISERCKAAAALPNGIYRLNVPTGAGKTLSSLRYALTHAKLYRRKRIFYIAPLLTILEQNADVIRNAVGDPQIVLEHHSNIIKSELTEESLSIYELLKENWAAPIVITTLVQLLNALFSGDTACVRRMQALTGSVIIIDEIQSLPRKIISLMNQALNFLAYICGATVVLCSATQPCFEELSHKLVFAPSSPDLVPYEKTLWQIFDRAKVFDLTKPGGYSAEDTAKLAYGKLSGCDSVLLICNTKTTARQLFFLLQNLRENSEISFNLLHLSASMCPAHRREVLGNIGKPPRAQKLICVTTQIVEAGVDISFECVIRMLAGIDNIAQAAGRCNRSGEYHKICEVDLINADSQLENLSHLEDIRLSKDAAQNTLYTFRKTPDYFECDLLSEKSVRNYYQSLFRAPDVKKKLDYPIPDLNTSLYSMLSCNRPFSDMIQSGSPAKQQILKQAFSTAGKYFRIFEDNTTDVIVPFNQEAKHLIAELSSQSLKQNLPRLKALLTAAKPYTVSLYDYALNKLEKTGSVTAVQEGSVYLLAEGCYHPNAGIDPSYDLQNAALFL